jgi:hypothetical protein
MKSTSRSLIGAKSDNLRSGQFRQDVTIEYFLPDMSQLNAEVPFMLYPKSMPEIDTMNNGMPETTTPVIPVFLVLERDALIAEDIMGSLADMGPCRTIHVSDASEITPHLSAEPAVSAVFLEMRLTQVLELGLDRRLAEHGAHVILTIGEDDAAHAHALGWGMLVRPFTDEMLREALMGTIRRRR